MENRCYSCASGFGFLRKELGCKNCGRAFCSTCLPHRITLSGHGDKCHRVCAKCFQSLTGNQSKAYQPGTRSPPANYKKRVAALQKNDMKWNATAVPAQPPANSVKGLDSTDKEIAERLQKLKANTKSSKMPSDQEMASRLAALGRDYTSDLPSASEIEDRLAKLQGKLPAGSRGQRPVHLPPDSRTQTEQMTNLLRQMAEEAELDNHQGATVSADAVNDLNLERRPAFPMNIPVLDLEEEKRNILVAAQADVDQESQLRAEDLALARSLALIKGEDPEKVVNWEHNEELSEEENDDVAVSQLMKQFVDEAALDERSGIAERPCMERKGSQNEETRPRQMTSGKFGWSTEQEPQEEEEEELPWCCICNENASLRCHGCDGDLYCNRCFREGHDKFDREEHSTEAYKPKRRRVP
uniref:abscission/NoCut checkpoint regulator isoform X2 n=1 Tax=Myxine glutinosa TaxID=7769 RepID=UPI0035900486